MIRGLVLLAAAGLFTVPAVAAPTIRVAKKKPALKRGGAASGPQLKIDSANITKARGTEIELGLGLFKRGERGRHKVEVWFVDGRQRHKLWQGDSTFAGTRGGFRNAVTVNLRGRNLSRGKIEVVAPSCAGNGCKRTISLAGGANLKFDGPQNIERRGSDSILTLKVKNTGAAKSRGCKLQVHVNGRTAKTFRVPGIDPNRSKTFDYRFGADKRGKNYEAKLVCRDLVRFDNVKRARLR